MIGIDAEATKTKQHIVKLMVILLVSRYIFFNVPNLKPTNYCFKYHPGIRQHSFS